VADGHAPYWNDFLDDTYCMGCGALWPCVPERESITCKCSHAGSVHGDTGTGECWSTACGCRYFRLRGVA
jgi:hypothetical protein